jgi:hypothetical protein
VHDAGKHFACSLATYSHCYFNDDDWLNIYIDSLYTKYLDCCTDTVKGGRSPIGVEDRVGGRIASNTMPIIHLEHRRWRVSDPGLLNPLSALELSSTVNVSNRYRYAYWIYVAGNGFLCAASFLDAILDTTKCCPSFVDARASTRFRYVLFDLVKFLSGASK